MALTNKEHQANFRKRNRQRLSEQRRNNYHNKIAELKEQLGGQCCKCGSKEKLEFNHKHPTGNDVRITTCWDRKELEGEMKKVELLCKKCHREVTNKQMTLAWHLFFSLTPELQEQWLEHPPTEASLQTLFQTAQQTLT